ncbi:MAG: Flp pilus assembly complex ATPase component TadA [Peptococcaceae bacterium]|nr:Flp pilus assembly complex ATPase component TadA [Peptococcaceae bacterium]MBQ2905739.1 Flp pilus assembly complex ATPase component TadA [Peptococcaceae bacterium]MBQ3205914.1 Flp pilus assembly complex ATPase component TadA [Peptococcaceae bacterium]
MAYKRLGEVLIAAGVITEADLERGLALQKGSKERLGTVLIANGIITEEHLMEALQLQLGVDFVDLTKVNIPVELAQLVPKNIARAHQVVPVKVMMDELYLAMSDPLNFYAMEEVQKAVRKKVVPVLATADAIEHAMQVLYGNEGAAKAIEEMKREAAERGAGRSDDDYAFVSNKIDDESVNSAPTIRLVNSIIERAVTERASDIHLEPQEFVMQVRIRVDGLMRDTLTVPKDLQGSVISRLKIMAGLNIAERRIPQDGRCNIKVKQKDIDLRVSTLPTVYGEKIVVRLLDKTGGAITKDAIGMSGDDLEKYEKMIRCRSGVILIAGPTGSGKSTTMNAMIGDLNRREVNLVTLEDPVEYNIEGVNQVQINEKTGMTFANGLRAILRQDPDIIAVGEIRDGETAEIAMRAAITGHVVLSTVHTNDAVGTIERLIDIGVEPYLVASALRGVISQRLVRRLCPHCKEAYQPSAEELQDLGIADGAGMQFYRSKGCPKCFDTGYHGRIAVFEFLPVDRAIRTMISDGSARAQIEAYLKDAAQKTGFISLRDNGLRLLAEGVTSVEELLRVIAVED